MYILAKIIVYNYTAELTAIQMHSVEGCYNTTGTNIATGYRDNKGMLQRQAISFTDLILDTNL